MDCLIIAGFLTRHSLPTDKNSEWRVRRTCAGNVQKPTAGTWKHHPPFFAWHTCIPTTSNNQLPVCTPITGSCGTKPISMCFGWLPQSIDIDLKNPPFVDLRPSEKALSTLTLVHPRVKSPMFCCWTKKHFLKMMYPHSIPQVFIMFPIKLAMFCWWPSLLNFPDPGHW